MKKHIKKSDIFQSKVEAQPDNMLFRFSLGQALYEEGDFKRSIPHLKLCVESREDWMLPQILLGKALIYIGSEAEAKYFLETALELATTQKHDDPVNELRSILSDL